jgi:hypothetical protein
MRQDSQINTANDRMLRDDQYALIVMDKQASQHKLFPVASKNDVMESCIEFDNYHQDLGPGEQKTAAFFLKQACQTWGLAVPPVIEDIASSKAEIGYNNIRQAEVPVAPIAKQASANYQHFALERVGRFAIDTPQLVKTASDYFDKHWSEFDLADRRDFAQAVKSRASDLGVQVSDQIHKFASDSFNPNLAGQISLRRSSVKDESLKQAYTKLWSHRNDLTVDQFADFMGRLDKKAGIDAHYSNGVLMDPLTATTGVAIQKEASLGSVNGADYTASDVVRAVTSMSEKSPGLFGESMIEQLKKHPEIFTSLPMPEQETILSYAN